MSSYQEINLTLTNGQRQKLRRAFGKDSSITMTLKHSQLGGPDRLLVPGQTAKKVARHRKAGTGVRLTLSKTALKANRRGGGVMSLLQGPLLGLYGEVAKDAVKDIFGSGMSPNEVLEQAKTKSSDAQREEAMRVLSIPANQAIIKRAKTPEEMARAINKIASKTMMGSGGQSGEGWKDALLWAGAWLNPFGLFTGPALVNYKAAEKLIKPQLVAQAQADLEERYDAMKQNRRAVDQATATFKANMAKKKGEGMDGGCLCKEMSGSGISFF